MKGQGCMHEEQWKLIELALKKEFPDDQELWLDHIQYLSSSDEGIYITVPDQIYKDRFSDKYFRTVTAIMDRQFNERFPIHVMVNEEEEEELLILDGDTSALNPPVKAPERKVTSPNLDLKNTFDQFVVGTNNQLAHAAGLRIAEYPGMDYNPFFVYGGVGLGKTHLMQAIGHDIKSRDPLMKVLYVTSEQFTNEYVNSIHKNQIHNFRLKYRDADVLLVDDIQFLEKKEGIQEELFHTFNKLQEDGKQMVFTSDRSPRELKLITDRLLSRFASGLVADIKAPDFETRKAILLKKMMKNNIHIENSILEFLANNITNNVRDLEAAVIKLKSIVDLLKEKLTLERVELELKDILNYHDHNKHISIEKIQKEVANYYNISYSDMKSKKRNDAIARPRQIAVFLAKHLTQLSTTELGNEFGGRNHSTIIFAYQKIDKEIQVSESLRNDIDHLKSKLLRV